MLFHFEPGQLVTRRYRLFSKLDPRTTGPFRVRRVGGVYRQRVTIEPTVGSTARRIVTVHASQLVPYEQPYTEPDAIDLHPDTLAEDPTAQHEDQPADAKDQQDDLGTRTQDLGSNQPQDAPDDMQVDDAPPARRTRSKRKKTAIVANIWTVGRLLAAKGD